MGIKLGLLLLCSFFVALGMGYVVALNSPGNQHGYTDSSTPDVPDSENQANGGIAILGREDRQVEGVMDLRLATVGPVRLDMDNSRPEEGMLAFVSAKNDAYQIVAEDVKSIAVSPKGQDTYGLMWTKDALGYVTEETNMNLRLAFVTDTSDFDYSAFEKYAKSLDSSQAVLEMRKATMAGFGKKPTSYERLIEMLEKTRVDIGSNEFLLLELELEVE